MNRTKVALIVVAAVVGLGLGWVVGADPTTDSSSIHHDRTLLVDPKGYSWDGNALLTGIKAGLTTGNTWDSNVGTTLGVMQRQDANRDVSLGALRADLALAKAYGLTAAQDANATRNATDVVCSASYRIVVDGNSNLITAMSGGPTVLPDNLMGFSIVREAGTVDQIHYASGTASTSTPQWESGGAFVPYTATAARLLKFITSDNTIYATMRVYIPR